MKLARALLVALILLGVISKFSVVAYQKDMDVLTTINEVEHQDPTFAIQEEARAKRDSVIINYALAVCTVAFLVSFAFGKKPEYTSSSEKNN